MKKLLIRPLQAGGYETRIIPASRLRPCMALGFTCIAGSRRPDCNLIRQAQWGRGGSDCEQNGSPNTIPSTAPSGR